MQAKDLVERYSKLKERHASLTAHRAGLVDRIDRNKKRVTAIEEELKKLGVDPTKVGEYIASERERIKLELDTLESSLNDFETKLLEAKSSVEAVS